jgi:hypothetical protein
MRQAGMFVAWARENLGILGNLGQKESMEPESISNLLKHRNAWLKGAAPDHETARQRKELTILISRHYLQFETTRDLIIEASDSFLRGINVSIPQFRGERKAIVDELEKHGLVFRHATGNYITEQEGRKYLSGAWLEELAWLAMLDAGAEEAVFGQVLGWKVGAYSGENEIDLIARRGSRLAFVSCKALRGELDMHDRKHRNRLMEALHEADNLTDHFGRDGEKVAVLVTTDLFDEARGVARYNALMGKAQILDVRIIPLEELGWDKLVLAMQDLWTQKTNEGAAA